MLILKVTVDSLWASNDLAFGLVLLEILCQQACIGVRVIATNYNKTIEIKGLRICQRAGKLLRGLNLVSSRADHIKATGVTVKVHVFGGNFHVVIRVNTMRSC